MKKVAFLIQHLSNGGAERVVSNISLNFDSSKYEHYLITYSDDIEYKFASKHISMGIKRPKTLLGKLLVGARAKRKLKHLKSKYKFDCVISFTPSPNIINAKTKTKSEKCILSVRTYRSHEDIGIRGFIFKTQTKKYYNNADKIVACSKMVEYDMKKNYGVIPSKLTTIYNPYNITEIIANTSNESPMDPEYFNIVNVGRLDFQKGQWHLLNVFKQLNKIYPKIRLYILGRGPYMEDFQNFIIKNNLQNNVFLMGFQSNVYDYYKFADMSVISSLFEGITNALTESLIFENPVVSVDCLSGPREIMTPDDDILVPVEKPIVSKYGILIPSFDVVDDRDNITEHNKIVENYMLESIVKLYTDETLRTSIIKNTLSRARDFDERKIICQWENLI